MMLFLPFLLGGGVVLETAEVRQELGREWGVVMQQRVQTGIKPKQALPGDQQW